MNNLTSVSSLFTEHDNFQLVPEDIAGIPLESTRYIFTAGDYLDPARKDQLPHLRRGGDELLSNPCLLRTPNRFLPRCAITPLEIGGETLIVDHFPTDMPSARPKLKVKGGETPDNGGRLSPPTFLYPRYPGEMIRDATGAGNENRGIVEISYLQGVDWGTGEAQAIQSTIFPDDWELPIELRLVEEQINRAADANTATIKDICGEMLQSCELFRRYGLGIIGRENTQIAQRVQHLHIYSYSAQCRSLAAQLEVKLVPSTTETLGSEVAKALAMAGNRSLDARDVQVLTVAVAEAVKQALAQTAPPPVVEPQQLSARNPMRVR